MKDPGRPLTADLAHYRAGEDGIAYLTVRMEETLLLHLLSETRRDPWGDIPIWITSKDPLKS